VWLSAPRMQSSLMLPPGGRADLLVGCAKGGTHVFGSLGSITYGGTVPAGGEVVRLEVELDGAPSAARDGDGDAASVTASMDARDPLEATLDAMTARLPQVLPGPPDYYRTDLRGVDVAARHQHTISFSTETGLNVVNQRAYNASRYDWQLELGEVVEWTIRSAESPATSLKFHPFHQHVTHFQVVEIADTGPPLSAEAAEASAHLDPQLDLLASVGDWRDTLPLYGRIQYRVRFVAPFTGPLTVHCHIQKHSDEGMMAVALVS